jgi:hypothetical protein
METGIHIIHINTKHKRMNNPSLNTGNFLFLTTIFRNIILPFVRPYSCNVSAQI